MAPTTSDTITNRPPEVLSAGSDSFPNEEHSHKSKMFVQRFRTAATHSCCWLHCTWPDILIMIGVVLAAWGLSHAHIFRQQQRTFPLWRNLDGGWYGPVSISHPKQALILNNLVAALIFVGVPMAVMLLMQFRIRNFWDANAGIFGLLKALVAMYVAFGSFRLSVPISKCLHVSFQNGLIWKASWKHYNCSCSYM